MWQLVAISLERDGGILYTFRHRIRVDHPLGSVYTDSETHSLPLKAPNPAWQICDWLSLDQITDPSLVSGRTHGPPGLRSQRVQVPPEMVAAQALRGCDAAREASTLEAAPKTLSKAAKRSTLKHRKNEAKT